MSTLSGTELPKPKDWEDFERKICVLFSCVLNDPNTELNGRQGQSQHGVDVYGYRECKTEALVGVQCKKKYTENVSKEELEEEVKKALKFEPRITEFILATTAPRDQKNQKEARLITERLSKTDQPIKVYVWGWDDIEHHAAQHRDAWLAFDPTFNPFAEHQGAVLSAQIEQLGKKFDSSFATVRTSKMIVEVERNNRDDTELYGRIKALEEVAESGNARVALESLQTLKDKSWDEANEGERYRLLASMGAAHHQLGDNHKAGTFLLRAVDAFPTHRKAGLSRAKGLFLTRRFEEALKHAEPLLADEELGAEAAGIAIQARYMTGKADKALENVPDKIMDNPTVLVAIVSGKRNIDDGTWVNDVLGSYKDWPEDEFLTQFAADALLERVLQTDVRFSSSAALGEEGVRAIREAVSLYQKLLNHPKNKETISESLANNAALAFRISGEDENALSLLDLGLSSHPQDQYLCLQRAAIARNADDYQRVLDLLRDDQGNPEAQILLAEAMAATGERGAALNTVDAIDLDELPDGLRLSAYAVKARCYCEDKDIAGAKALVDGLQKNEPENAAYLALKIKVYRTLDGMDAARSVLENGDTNLATNGELGGAMELAYEARKLDRYDIVVRLLEGRVSTHKQNEGLMLLLSAYIEGNFPKKARDFLEALPEAVQELSEIQRADAVLAIRVGDPDADKHLGKYLRTNPNDLDMVLARIGIWQRQGRTSDIRRYVKGLSARNFKDSPVRLMGLASAYVQFGRALDGLKLSYRLLMDNWNNHVVHLRYHGLLLMHEEVRDVMPGPTMVGMDSVVRLENGAGEKLVYRFEESAPAAFASEHIEERSDIGKILLGRVVGDNFPLQDRAGAKNWTIKEVKHVWLDALHRSMEIFNTRFPRAPGLVRFDVKLDGDAPFEDMESTLKESAEREERVLNHYRDHVVPFLFISSMIGRDPIEAWASLVAHGRDFRVCLGTREERENVLQLLKSRERQGCVLDPITLSVVQRLGVAEAVIAVCGPLKTTQSVLDVFLEREAEGRRGATFGQGSLGYRDGQIYAVKYTEDDLRNAESARHADLEWVRDACDIVAAVPKQDLKDNQRTLVEMADPFVWEPAIAAQGHDLLLLSDDMGCRAWAESALGVSSTWLQPVLMIAQDEGHLTDDEYHLAVTTLAQSRYCYTSLSVDDIFYPWSKDGFEVSEAVVQTVRMIGGPISDLRTNIGIVSSVIEKALKSGAEQNAICRFAGCIFGAMSNGRGQYQAEIVEHILSRLSAPPFWFRSYASSWLVGHSIGMENFEELLAMQKKLQARM